MTTEVVKSEVSLKHTYPSIGPQLYCGTRTIEDILNWTPVKDKKLADGRPFYWVKPDKGGLWTSTYTPNEDCASDWIRWCHAENFIRFTKDNHKYVLITPRADARIYEINTYDDLRQLVKQYRQSGPYPDFCMGFPVGFEELQKDYDIIHLTENGQWATRLSEPFNLYGWDCESCLWLNNVIDQIEYIDCVPSK